MLTQTAVAGTPNVDRQFNVARKSETAEGVQLGVALGFERNAEIYAEGEDSGYVYKIVSGVVRVCKLLPDGRRQITAFHMPGEMFGLEADDIHHTSAEAVVPTKVIAYRWEGVVETERQPANFVRELLSQSVRGLRLTQDHLLLLGRKNALERLAAFLLEMDPRTGSKHVLNLVMPRHDIADYLGLTIETVSRMFAVLKHMGTIELESSRRVRILDKAKLTAISA